jgi:hypothetical protein
VADAVKGRWRSRRGAISVPATERGATFGLSTTDI